LRENYEAAARTREERAREEERKKQESIRAREHQKLETTIQEREEREKVLQERLTDREDEQQAGQIQIQELMQHSDLLEDQNCMLKDRLVRQSDGLRALKDQVHDSSHQISRFLTIGRQLSKSLEQEIVMLLDILNYEIYQAAACIADLLESQSQLPLKAALQCLGPFN
jgi:preprotein translocase subunit SecF